MLNVTVDTFEKEVLQSELPVVVDFWATWCGPCKMFGPILEDFAKSAEGKVKVCKVDIDEQMPLARQYDIMSVPTVLVFKNGMLVNSSVGVITKAQLAELADVAL
ncbi:thioredoxin [Ructibacterium gallinarum]|uniref:Thioredoxin n=1 Tax=Ructibacterium gallinarum TaxID=2779355 RepID=A0A9D5LY40_9FIRM|nr:thioredoxin [Ructibacterium gallinarum]MBE5039007.1 thioredoxin [Ructibacterium gallinarum]